MPYYEFSLTGKFDSEEEAEEFMDAMCILYCRGEGEGDDHVCQRWDWAASSRRYEDDDDDMGTEIAGMIGAKPHAV